MKRLLSYNVANLQGKGSREYQEDSFGFVNALDVTEIRIKGLFAAVADGMGGMQGGREASTLVMKTMMADFENMDRKAHLGLQLAQSILHAGDLVYQMLRGAGGSTIVAGIFYNEMLYFASVGDSTIWLVRDGEVIHLNEPHNMKLQRYHESFSAGIMDPFPGRRDIQSYALTQHVGMREEAKVDMNYRPLRLENKDVLIFCSDGVGEVLTEEEVLYCLDSPLASDACARMESLIRQKDLPGQDNYTALVIKCSY